MLYVAFESIEGAGKTTVLMKLRELFKEAVFVREPGGTPTAERIRSIAIGANANDEPLEPETELMMFMGARVELLRKVVRPALDQGKLVFSDRSYYTTLAYQGQATHGLAVGLVKSVIRPIASPNLVIYLDVDVATSRQRVSGRDALDKIEQRDDAFFEAARQNYLKNCHILPNKHIRVDATQSPEKVLADVLDALAAVGVVVPA